MEVDKPSISNRNITKCHMRNLYCSELDWDSKS